MGFLGRLFGGTRPPRVPSWATELESGERFVVFIEAAARFLAGQGVRFDRAELATGSVMLGDGAARREWILEEAAERCAGAEQASWPRIIEEDFRGEGSDRAIVEAAQGAPGREWTIGTSTWGGVLLECGPQQVVLLLLPVTDPSVYDELPELPPAFVEAVVVLNTRPGGVLAGQRVGKRAGRDSLFATSPTLPVDRGIPGVADPGRIRCIEGELRFGPLRLEAHHSSVLSRWDDGASVLVGDAVTLQEIATARPRTIVGALDLAGEPPADLVDALAELRDVILLATIPGADAQRDAQILSQLGISTRIVNEPPPGTSEQIMIQLVLGKLEQAERLADEALARDESPAEMHFQRAVAALMRGDDTAAERELEVAAPDMPQAQHSLALLLARRGDARCCLLAREALQRLPADPVAIRGAVLVHRMAGDREGALALLRGHGEHLDRLERAQLEAAIGTGALAPGTHSFPEHARVAAGLARRYIDEKRLEEAEPLLHRAVDLDPAALDAVTDLAYVLSRQGRDEEAVSVCDGAIARGGMGQLLRFNRGNCHLRLGRPAQAEEDFRACLDLRPDWHDARVNLIAVLHARGRTSEAREELARLREIGGPSAYLAALDELLG